MACCAWLVVCVVVLCHVQPTACYNSVPSWWCDTCTRDVKTLQAAKERLQKKIDKLTTTNAGLQTIVDALDRNVTEKRCKYPDGAPGSVVETRRESGVESLGGDETPVVEFNSRVHTRIVPFTAPFSASPRVMVGLTLVNMTTPANVEVGLLGAVTPSSFPLFVRQWGTGGQTRVSWMACAL